jgi:hypothetical protein
MAKLYTVDGIVIDVLPKNRKSFSLEEMKMIVGGVVQIVPMPDGDSIVVNDEGKLIGLKINEEATKFWRDQYPIKEYPANNDELIVGNCLIATNEELGEGEEEEEEETRSN